MVHRPDAGLASEGQAGWLFEKREEGARQGADPLTLRHPEAAWVWRKRFDPSLPVAWTSIEWSGEPTGIVDARLILVFADGARLAQAMAKTGRNRCRALFRPLRPLAAIEVVLSGSSPSRSWRPPQLRAVSPGSNGWRWRAGVSTFLGATHDRCPGGPRGS